MIVFQIGSIFSLLILWHFVVDWLFQSQSAAIDKSTDSMVRANHCIDYALAFIILLTICSFSSIAVWASALVLFVSHFIIDTYIPTYWWVKYTRKPLPVEQFTIEKFKEYAATPIGAIITITVDQIFHLVFVLIVAILCVLL